MMKTYFKKGQNDICVYNRKFAYSYAKLKRTKPAELEKYLKQYWRDERIVSVSKPRSRWMNRELIGFEIRSSDNTTTNYKVHKNGMQF